MAENGHLSVRQGFEPMLGPILEYEAFRKSPPGSYDSNKQLLKTWDELLSAGLVKVDANGLLSTVDIEYEYDTEGNEHPIAGPWNVFGGVSYMVIPEGVTGIKYGAFYRCEDLKEVVIPKTVTSIESGVFRESGIVSLDIPYGVTTLPDYAFDDCAYLERISIPSSVTTMGYRVFSRCERLKRTSIPGSVKELKPYTFEYCSKLEKVEFNEGTEIFGDRLFYMCTNLKEAHFPSTAKSIGQYMFDNCREMTEVTMPDYDFSPTCGGMFNGCKKITSFNIPSSFSTIPYGFFGLSGISGHVEIPNGVTEIKGSAFYGCEGITSVSIPNTVTAIGSMAFRECRGLTEITIPNSVTTIGSNAFFWTTSGLVIHYSGTATGAPWGATNATIIP